jgi:hypothetical protein
MGDSGARARARAGAGAGAGAGQRAGPWFRPMPPEEDGLYSAASPPPFPFFSSFFLRLVCLRTGATGAVI